MDVFRKIIIAIFLIFLFFSLTKNLLNYQEKVQFWAGFRKKYEDEQRKNLTLKTELLKKSDFSEIEKTIRNRLNMLKPSEAFVILAWPTPTPQTISPTPLPVWRQWQEVFFK